MSILFSEIYTKAVALFDDPQITKAYQFNRVLFEKKMYTYHTGYVGGLKQTPYKQMMATKSDVVVYEAVKGMLPHNTLGKSMLKKLRVYKGDKHEHAAQQPETLKLD